MNAYKNSHINNGVFSCIKDLPKRFPQFKWLLSLGIYAKTGQFSTSERLQNHYTLLDGPAAPQMMIVDHFVSCAQPIRFYISSSAVFVIDFFLTAPHQGDAASRSELQV